MFVREIFEAGVKMAWGKSGSKSVRKYRCTSGVRKGRVMSSPAACNKPINPHKSAAFKLTKLKKAGRIKFRSGLTKRSNPASVRNRKLNTSSRSTGRARKIK